MRRALWFLLVGVGIGLAALVVPRLSMDGRAVVVGVLVGVAASVPTSLLLIALLRQPMRPAEPRERVDPYPPMLRAPKPDIIVWQVKDPALDDGREDGQENGRL